MSLNRMIIIFVVYLVINSEPSESGSVDKSDEIFEFTRVEPGNALGITTKVIAHVHRPAQTTTETWTLNREFTPDYVLKALNSTCEKLIVRDKYIKWENCKLDKHGFTADLTHGRPETKNKTYVYLAMSYDSFEMMEGDRKLICALGIVNENPSYFLLETFSKAPSNDSVSEESIDAFHVHQLGKFGKEFLSVYGNSIDQDKIYNFDVMDFYERDDLYECFLSIGSSASVSVLEQKCPIFCLETPTKEELENEEYEHVYRVKPMTQKRNSGKDNSGSDNMKQNLGSDSEEEDKSFKAKATIRIRKEL